MMQYANEKQAMNGPPYQGARFYKCALQLNSASYAAQYQLSAHNLSEDDYNQNVLSECKENQKENQIEVVGLADHGTVSDSQSLRMLLQENDITVFPGFEISSSEKIHMVCLYPETTSEDELNRYLGQLVGGNARELKRDKTYPSSRSCQEIAEEIIKKQDGFWYAAHMTGKNGLLRLSGAGDNYAHLWKKHEIVIAGQISGTIQDLPDQRYKDIIENKNPDYERKRPIAIINAKDVVKPDDLKDPSASCLIKMTEPTMASLRNAFYDPESRIMLNHTKQTSHHSKIKTIKLEGGRYQDCELRLSEKLNVIIGGHGTGKSTLIESLRYVFDKEPAEGVKKTYESLCKDNLRDSRISIMVRSSAQRQNKYTISRRYGESAEVRSQHGEVSQLGVKDIMPAVEIYSQNEILEIAKDNEAQIKLLDRFLPSQNKYRKHIAKLKRLLRENRDQLLKALDRKDDLESGQNEIPKLKEEINQLDQLGIVKKLRNAGFLEKEGMVIDKSKQEVAEAESWLSRCGDLFDFGFFDMPQFDQLPNRQLLDEIKAALEKLKKSYYATWTALEKEKDTCRQAIANKEQQWRQRKESMDNELREAINTLPDHGGRSGQQLAEDYKQLQKELTAVEGEKNVFKNVQLWVKELEKERKEFLQDYRELFCSRSQKLKDAIDELNKGSLKGRLRIECEPAGVRSKLKKILAGLPGIGEKKLAWVDKTETIFPATLAEAVKDKDIDTLLKQYKEYGLTAATAERIVGMEAQQRLELEEMEMEDSITIKLNTEHDVEKCEPSPSGDSITAELNTEHSPSDSPCFHELDNLSTGQKCIAILNILLLSNKDPLIVDQPEDNLDNAFIADRIVEDLRAQKNNRQFIFATHNANIPVFGDAELIAVLKIRQSKAKIDQLGSIDKPDIQKVAAQILEGGKDAFNIRKKKYGF